MPMVLARRAALLLVLALVGILLIAVTRAASPDPATASSHREAPLIADDPSADNTGRARRRATAR